MRPSLVMQALSFVGFFAVAALVTLCALWASDSTPPVTIEAMRVLTPVVEAGGTVQIEMSVDRHRSCRLHVEHLLTDAMGKRVILPDLDFDALPGALGRDHFTDTYRVPKDFAPGLACYRRISRYSCNPIHAVWPIVLDRGVGHGSCFTVVAPKD